MKKLLALLFTIVFLVAGCALGKDMTNTPTKKVEEYLDGYKTLDDKVMDDLDDLIDKMTNYSSSQKDRYKKIMKDHYEDLDYEVKSENIDGDTATVEVEISVRDYSKVLNESTDLDEFKTADGKLDEEKYYDYQLDLLEKVKDKVKYTITFNLTKEDKVWKIDEPNEIVKQKIHGIYAY